MARNEPHRQVTDLSALLSLDWLCSQWCTHHQKSFIERWFWRPHIPTVCWFLASALPSTLDTVIATGTLCSGRKWRRGPDPPLNPRLPCIGQGTLPIKVALPRRHVYSVHRCTHYSVTSFTRSILNNNNGLFDSDLCSLAAEVQFVRLNKISKPIYAQNVASNCMTSKFNTERL